MKKILFFTLSILLVVSCGTKKKISEAIATGNYDAAIDMSIKKLKKNKNTKRADTYVMLLEEAFAKAQNRDLKRIEQLKRDTKPGKWEEIYQLYNNLMERQEKIEPLLPLYVTKQNRQAKFEFHDYMPDLINARDHMVAYKYEKAKELLRYQDKNHIRQAYDILEDIDRIYPDYKDVKSLMDEAHRRGISKVGVIIENKSNKIIPQKLQEELLNFNSLNANNFWTVYEPVSRDTARYDYLAELIITDIYVGPEKEQEKVVERQREIQTGWQNVYDQSGRVVKDSLGRPIRRPVYKVVRAVVHIFRQFKEAGIKAHARIIDNRTRKVIFTRPLESAYVFENIYLKVNGDKRALDNELNQYVDHVRLPFPSNEQIISDAGRDLKIKFEDLLFNARFD